MGMAISVFSDGSIDRRPLSLAIHREDVRLGKAVRILQFDKFHPD